MRSMVWFSVLPSKGRLPAIRTNMVTPRAHTSHFSSYLTSPDGSALSGLMYSTVPTFSSCAAIGCPCTKGTAPPKSMIFSSSFSTGHLSALCFSRKFSALRSRWQMPRLCMWQTPLRSCCMSSATCRSVTPSPCTMKSKSSPPLQSSITRNKMSLSSYTSWSCKMFGWSSLPMISISLSRSVRVTIFNGTCLIANIFPLSWLFAV
mmetsp:Transcript_11956/g.33830  ORF Transcript_11956/g.33830 Transcript_11956/m.33830 type:complete len:205 (-) Transcript_11956:233-847(-)